MKSEKKETFTSIINNSFNDFLKDNQITYPNLSREHLNQWDFLKYLQEKKSITFTEEQITEIPSIKLERLKNEPHIIKFCGMIQNVIENQLYMCTKYNDTTKAYEVNKYYEAPIVSNSQLNDEDDLGCCDENDDSLLLCDRLVLKIIPIPGLHYSLYEEFGYEGLKDKKIIVYDYTNSFSKVSEEILTIGVAYMKENEIVIHSWKTISNYLSLRMKTISITDDQIIPLREKMIQELKKECLFNDLLSAEYVLMYFLSQVFLRIGQKNLGSFPLNLVLSDKTTLVASKISSLMKNICLYTTELDITIKELNQQLFYPRFDAEKDELMPGILQQCNKSFVILNELNMVEGKLEETGIKNVGCLKNLIDFQIIQYDYPYNPVEIQHDCEIISFTKGQKSLFVSPFMSVLPLVDFEEDPNAIMIDDSNNPYLMLELFNFINLLRYNELFISNFIIEDSISTKIQADYISKQAKFNPEEFDRCLKLCRLYAISKGRSKLIYEDYLIVLEFENQRLKRLETYFKNQITK